MPGFLSKNIIDESDASSSALIQTWVAQGNTTIVEKDIYGKYHFNGNFKNAGDLKKALENIGDTSYSDLIQHETQKLLDIFEKVFHHKYFVVCSCCITGTTSIGKVVGNRFNAESSRISFL